jgi:hypothetical protein
MAELRRLGDSDPNRSLTLAREGNMRFPDSPDAPERAWRVVKSLVNLQQFHEARDEAVVMVKHYPRTRWTLEVQRHMLVNPLDYPSREEQQRTAQRGAAP